VCLFIAPSRQRKIKKVLGKISQAAAVGFPAQERVNEQLSQPGQLFEPAPPPIIPNGHIQQLERPVKRLPAVILILGLPVSRPADLTADIGQLFDQGKLLPAAAG